MADLETMRLALRKKIGSPTDTDVTDDLLTRLINAAYREIGSKYAFNETRCIKSFDTVSGTNRYTVPEDLAALFKVWDDTNKRPLYKRGASFLSALPSTLKPGKPRFYVRLRDWIQIVPDPNEVNTIMIYYLTEIEDLTENASTPVLPLPWHDGIVLKARHLYYDERGDIGKAIYSKNEWKDWLSDKPSEIDLEKVDIEESVIVLSPFGMDTRRAYRDRRFDPLFDYTE